MPISNFAPAAQIRRNYGTTVATVADLRAVTASERFANQLVYVSDVDATYEFEPTSVAVDDGDLILEPDDSPATGRWEKRGAGILAPAAHATSHTDGSDDIQDATAAQKGVATAVQITKLDAIEALADVTDATNVNAAGAVMQIDIGNAGVVGRIRRTGAEAYTTIKDATAEAVDPIVSNDNTEDYEVGSIWLNTTADKAFIAIDVSTGAAIWLRIGTTILESFQFFADQFENPVNTDWIINALAPAVPDSINTNKIVRAFDDTVEEGIGFTIRIPAGAKSMILKPVSRALTGPPASRTVGLKLYQQGDPDNAAQDGWSAAIQLADIDIPTTTDFFQHDSETLLLATIGVVADEITHFELTRDPTPVGGTNLVGDWLLLMLGVEFI